MTSPSPLGRYADGTGDTDLHRVQLLGTPVRVMLAGREHHDELMREFALLALRQDHARDLSDRLRVLIEQLGVRYGSAAARPDEVLDAAAERGEATVDLTYEVPAQVAEAASTLDDLMTEADEFCRSEQLMTLARAPVMAAFSRWYIDQFRRQIAGQDAQPWDGPLDV